MRKHDKGKEGEVLWISEDELDQMRSKYDVAHKTSERLLKVANILERMAELHIKVGKYKWEMCNGDIKPGHWSNLPDGEICTSPENVEGKAVIDGVLGDYFDGKYGCSACLVCPGFCFVIQ